MSFFKKDKSRILSVIMAVAIIVLVIVVLNIFRRQESVRKENDRLGKILEICTQQEDRDVAKYNREFYEKEIAVIEKNYSNKQKDLYMMREEKHMSAVIPLKPSFTDVCDWAEYYLGMDSVKPVTCYTTPEEMKEYLSAALEKENPASKVYLQIDPVELERNYFEAHRFDKDIDSLPTFLQIMNECLWNYLSVYSTTDFRIYLPMTSLEEWASYSAEEFEEIRAKYDQFVFYTSRFSNKELVWPIDKECFIANPAAFEGSTALSRDAFERQFLLNESSSKFDFTYNEFDDIWEKLTGYINDYRSGFYAKSNLEDTDVVLIGENLFANYHAEAFSVEGVVEAFTGASVYNVSGLSDCSRDLSLKAGEISKLNFNSPKQIFIINYGLADYLTGAKLGNLDDLSDTESFLSAMSAGISDIKKQFPDARIILMSPYRINEFKGGTQRAADGSLTLQEIAWNEDTLALNEGIEYINLYEILDLTENPGEFFEDGFFLNDAGKYIVGRTIASYLGNR